MKFQRSKFKLLIFISEISFLRFACIFAKISILDKQRISKKKEKKQEAI